MKALIVILYVLFSLFFMLNITFAFLPDGNYYNEDYLLINSKGNVEDLSKRCTKPGSHFFLSFFYDGTYDKLYTKILIFGLLQDFLITVKNFKNKECNYNATRVSDMFTSVEFVLPLNEVPVNSIVDMELFHGPKLIKICRIDMLRDTVNNINPSKREHEDFNLRNTAIKDKSPDEIGMSDDNNDDDILKSEINIEQANDPIFDRQFSKNSDIADTEWYKKFIKTSTRRPPAGAATETYEESSEPSINEEDINE
ncbi:uncharacterized protein LOC111624144 [Centruroides sculpturatus]|uniref:uncharacterized protein LOC111624144 n=1 Tax=Centruroides sculpturatus TaxID=218467 RepID=UPI000C6E06C4|nr:uncharacterized protein LOC111624144 [Centruroides sculpturatus]